MCPQCEQMTPKTADEGRVELRALRHVPQVYQSAKFGYLSMSEEKKGGSGLVYRNSLSVGARESRKTCLPCHAEVGIHLRQDLF